MYVAFELGNKEWKLAMTSGFGVTPWLRSVGSGDWRGVEQAMAQGRARFGLAAAAPGVSCYVAGRDGFWIHRALVQRGIRNRVVDAASIEVNRRARRAKTDRLDALKLVMMLGGGRRCRAKCKRGSPGRPPAGRCSRSRSRHLTVSSRRP